MASNRSILRAQELIPYRCALCDSEDGVKWFCNDCSENLCGRCKEAHKRGRKTKKDDVVSIGEANRQSDKLHRENQYKKIDIDSKHVQRISTFTVTQKLETFGICPVDDNHAWLSIYRYRGLVLVNKEGMIKKRVQLDFFPYMITMVGTTDICILLTNDDTGTYVYKLSLHNKQVTTFADIRPHKAYDVSINKKDEVFVSTNTPDIVVLNQSGTVVRKVTCGIDSCFITCLSSGDIAVSDCDKVSIITDKSGTTKHNWTGKLNKGQKVDGMGLRKMARDKYDRLFVPDRVNNQVYVLPRGSTRAKCLLDKKHGVIDPTAVGVDTCGNVWIGCYHGTVHVMGL